MRSSPALGSVLSWEWSLLDSLSPLPLPTHPHVHAFAHSFKKKLKIQFSVTISSYFISYCLGYFFHLLLKPIQIPSHSSLISSWLLSLFKFCLSSPSLLISSGHCHFLPSKWIKSTDIFLYCTLIKDKLALTHRPASKWQEGKEETEAEEIQKEYRQINQELSAPWVL